MVLAARKMKMRGIVEAIEITRSSLVSILVRWVPRLLKINHKRNRLSITKECLALFKPHLKEFLCLMN